MKDHSWPIRLIVRTLRWSHLSVVLFILVGWVLPWSEALALHVILIPAMIVQWQVNEGTCILTNLENKLRGQARERSEQQGQFIKGLLGRCLNPVPPDESIKTWLYVVLWTVWTVSGLRLLVSV